MNPNPIETERAIVRALEHLSMASGHLFQSETLNREAKLEANRLIDEARRILVFGADKAKVA